MLQNSKMTLIKYDNWETLSQFISAYNYYKLDIVHFQEDFKYLNRELLINGILDEDRFYTHLLVDIEKVKIIGDIGAGDRHSHNWTFINNLITGIIQNKDFKLILVYKEDTFDVFSHRANICLEILNDQLTIKKNHLV